MDGLQSGAAGLASPESPSSYTRPLGGSSSSSSGGGGGGGGGGSLEQDGQDGAVAVDGPWMGGMAVDSTAELIERRREQLRLSERAIEAAANPARAGGGVNHAGADASAEDAASPARAGASRLNSRASSFATHLYKASQPGAQQGQKIPPTLAEEGDGVDASQAPAGTEHRSAAAFAEELEAFARALEKGQQLQQPQQQQPPPQQPQQQQGNGLEDAGGDTGTSSSTAGAAAAAAAAAAVRGEFDAAQRAQGRADGTYSGGSSGQQDGEAAATLVDDSVAVSPQALANAAVANMKQQQAQQQSGGQARGEGEQQRETPVQTTPLSNGAEAAAAAIVAEGGEGGAVGGIYVRALLAENEALRKESTKHRLITVALQHKIDQLTQRNEEIVEMAHATRARLGVIARASSSPRAQQSGNESGTEDTLAAVSVLDWFLAQLPVAMAPP
eukprot:g6249.t1